MKRTDHIKTLLLLAIVSLMTACSESYPGIDYDFSKGGVMSNEDEALKRTPILLFANQQNFITITNTTRGTGSFSDEKLENKLDNASFYVYAFRSKAYNGGPSEFQEPTDFSQSHYSNKGTDTEYYHCLLDGKEYGQGAKTGLQYQGNGNLFFKNVLGTGLDDANEYYYSSTYPTVPYDFFGYYFDDIDMSNYHRDHDSIWYDITIDGTQDLLCGYAPRIDNEEFLKSEYASNYNNLPRAEIDNICNYGGFCTYAAQLGIHPHIKMEHQLTQLEFLAYPANKTANDIKITKIEVYSENTGRLVVASHNLEQVGFHPTGNKQPLVLHEESDGKTTAPVMNPVSLVYDTSIAPQRWMDQDSVKLGGSIMLNPQDSIKMTLYFQQEVPNTYSGSTLTIDRQSNYILKAPKSMKENRNPDGTYSFKPGLLYTVRIAVFGIEKIEVYTEVVDWESGGEIDVSEDEFF